MATFKRSAGAATPLPDSAEAWRMAAAAFTVGFVVFGIVYSFGVFLQPITNDFQVGRAGVSAYYAIASFIWYFFGPVSGSLSDRFGPKAIVLVGAGMMATGLVGTAFIGELWQGYLIYGVGVGLGAACTYVPTLANLGGWFVKRRDMAFGIAASGTGVGMLLVPPTAAFLIERYGWRDASIILGVASGLLLLGCASVVTAAPSAAAVPSFRQLLASLRSRAFLCLYASWILATAALFIPLVFLSQYALTIGVDPLAASLLLSVLGGVSVVGRLGIGFFGSRFSTVTLFKAAVLMMAASYLIWWSGFGYPSLVVFVVVLGLAYGVRIALVPSILIEFHGTANLGALLGVFFTATGLSSLLGPPLAGYVIDQSGSYDWGIALALLLGIAGLVVILPLRARRDDQSVTDVP